MSDSFTLPITIRCRGVRGSIPAPGIETARYGGNTSCVELRCGDELLILDAGSGIRNLGNELVEQNPPGPVETNLLISHTHWDHIQGLPFFVPGYSAQNRIGIFAAPDYGARVKIALRNQMTPLNFPVAFDQMRGFIGIKELDPGTNRIGRFAICTTELNHPGGCAGFRIEAEGIAVGYLPDHEPYSAGSRGKQRKKLTDFIRDLDLLILDTQYTAEEYSQRRGWGHGSLPESVRIALAGNVRRLLLFHHDPTHPDSQIDQMAESARDLANGRSLSIDAAAEDQTIELSKSVSAPIIPPTIFPANSKPLIV